MADSCGKCIYVEWDNKEKYSSKDRFWCKELRKYIESTDRACSYFVEDKSKKNNKPPCYITTIVVNILGYEDNCELLETLRNFRENVLKRNPMYLPILFEYDNVGPIISEYLNKENDEVFCLKLMQNFLLPCANYIKMEDTEKAVETYQNMVIYLNETFGLPTISVTIPKQYDLENLGKGRTRSIQTSEI